MEFIYVFYISLYNYITPSHIESYCVSHTFFFQTRCILTSHLYALTGIDRFHFKRKDRKRFNGTQRFGRRSVASRVPTESRTLKERALSFGPFLLSLGRILACLPHGPRSIARSVRICSVSSARFFTVPIPFVGGGGLPGLSYLPMMDDSVHRERAPRGDKSFLAKDDERISHSTLASHFGRSRRF